MFAAKNIKLLGICVGLLIIGFILLGQGPVYNPLSWTVAPLILVGVYGIMIPWAITAKDTSKAKEDKKGA